tara:strand:- start:385 stop:1059 length:675 start_codon:yes stop_codon:yes gene_type:complete
MSRITYILAMGSIVKTTQRRRAAELMALNPDMSAKEIAAKIDVHQATITNWRQDPNFVDMVYDIYMVEFGAEIPSVLKAMIREAKAGNVQAGRLVLEHSGKLVKNINITVDSPFEKYLKAEDAEFEYQDAEIQDIVEDIPDIPDVVLPERNKENQQERTRQEFASIKKERKNIKRKISRNKMYHLKERAKAAGVDLLPNGRPTKATKEAWIAEIEAKEKELGIK